MSNQEIDPRYQRGKIYKIVGSGMRYYGSTIQTLKKRLKEHKGDYKQWLEGKREYCKSFDIISKGDYEIKLVRLYPCNNKPELERKEGKYILKNECINKVVPGRTHTEWCRDNKDKCSNYCKNYRNKNKEKLKIFYNTVIECSCGKSYTKANKARHFKSKHHI